MFEIMCDYKNPLLPVFLSRQNLNVKINNGHVFDRHSLRPNVIE